MSDVQQDRFGNPLAPGVPYARGDFVGSTADDLRKRVFRTLYDSQLKEFTADKKRAEDLLKFGEAKRDESVDMAQHAAWTTVASAILNLDEVLTKE